MMADDRLLPCPFCGGEAEVLKLDLSSIDDGWQLYGVWCIDDIHAEEHDGYPHGHYIDNYATEAEAIEAWNASATHCTLTAEQVRHAVNRHHKLLMVLDGGGVDIPKATFDWQAIADELNDELNKVVEE